MSSFKAYVRVDEYGDSQVGGNGELDGFDPKSGLRILPGEVLISSAYNVLKFAPLSNRQGISGALFVTNFKLTFVTADKSSYELVDRSPKNNFLGECDVCLANIDAVYQVLESSGRKKKLLPGSNVSGRIELLQIQCKNFRIQTFSFKFSPLGEEKAVTNAILHHAFPPRVQLLFAFEYKGPIITGSSTDGTRLFNTATDWQKELNRLQAENHWRVSHLNENFIISKSLSETFVVPASVLDKQLNEASPHFQGNRVPTWSWSRPDGCAIVRCAGIHPGITENHQMEIMLEYIQLTHPKNHRPNIVDLDGLLPPMKDIQQSYIKLRELCMPDSPSQFWDQDNHYYSLLDNCKWLQNVAAFLDLAKNLAMYINQTKKVVILQEASGRDLSCIISSLMQIILDPHFRTMTGFQSLIQKEWIAMGHPFSNRLKLLRNTEDKQCPFFLVFLDCVWQIMQQFPSAFEFSEIYLTALWDCTYLVVFETFLFNSCWHRYAATREEANPLHRRSLWDWAQLYSKEEMALFHNPLFAISHLALEMLSIESLSFTSPRLRHGMPQMTNELPKTLSWYGIDNSTKAWSHSASKFSLNVLSYSKDNSEQQQSSTRSSYTQDKLSPASPSKWKVYRTLSVNSHSFLLQLWSHCYLRWVPLAQICGGGTPAIYLQRRNLVKEILDLEQNLAALSVEEPSVGGNDDLDFVMDPSQLRLASFERITSSFPFSPGGSPSFGLPLSFYRHSKYVASDDELNSETLNSLDE